MREKEYCIIKMRVVEYFVIANVESNRSNIEVMFSSDNLFHCREAKQLLEDLKHGSGDDMIEEDNKSNERILKGLSELGINIFCDGAEEDNYIPEVTGVKILETLEVEQ